MVVITELTQPTLPLTLDCRRPRLVYLRYTIAARNDVKLAARVVETRQKLSILIRFGVVQYGSDLLVELLLSDQIIRVYKSRHNNAATDSCFILIKITLGNLGNYLLRSFGIFR